MKASAVGECSKWIASPCHQSCITSIKSLCMHNGFWSPRKYFAVYSSCACHSTHHVPLFWWWIAILLCQSHMHFASSLRGKQNVIINIVRFEPMSIRRSTFSYRFVINECRPKMLFLHTHRLSKREVCLIRRTRGKQYEQVENFDVMLFFYSVCIYLRMKSMQSKVFHSVARFNSDVLVERTLYVLPGSV